MSKFEQIQAFIDVVEENGFAAAARKQGVTAGALSRQLSHLESNLRVELMQRTTRKISLTEIGAQYYHQCKKAIQELTEAEMAIAGSQTEATGTLTVMSNRYFAEQYLLPYLPEFMEDNPHLKINLELAERFPNLSHESIDVIFGVSIEGPSELIRRRVADTRYVFCASPTYLKKHGTPHAPVELAKHHYITHKMRVNNHIVTFKGGKEIFVEPILFLNDSRAMAECAMKGLGIVKLHDYIVDSALKHGELIEIFSEFSEQKQVVYLYYQKSRYLLPKIRRFIDFYERFFADNIERLV